MAAVFLPGYLRVLKCHDVATNLSRPAFKPLLVFVGWFL